jgi:hypothetical protein
MDLVPSAPRGQKRWVEAAENRLEPIVLAALRVHVALDVGRDSGTYLKEASTPLLTATVGLVSWLRQGTAPSGLGDAVAELHAAAGVYRNAAVVYPEAPELDAASTDARANACDAMLVQGEHHVAMFRSLVT